MKGAVAEYDTETPLLAFCDSPFLSLGCRCSVPVLFQEIIDPVCGIEQITDGTVMI